MAASVKYISREREQLAIEKGHFKTFFHTIKQWYRSDELLFLI
jgi:hypothetical protein